jgi:hypothetical protein
VQEYTNEFKKMDIMLGISPKNRDVLLKYLGGLHNHLQNKVILFKSKTIDEACVQAQYLENIRRKKGQPSGSKKKRPKTLSRGKISGKGNMRRCNIDGHT